MAVNHRKDSIQLIRDTEGINNKDRVRILSPDADPPEEVTDVTKHALYMEPKNTPADGEPYEYEFACCTGRRFIPQRAGDANKLEGKTSAEVKALFADGRAIFAGSGTSVTLDAEGDRVHSITVNGFTKQDGTGDASTKNVRALTCGGIRLTEFVLDGNAVYSNVTVNTNTVQFSTKPGGVNPVIEVGYCEVLELKSGNTTDTPHWFPSKSNKYLTFYFPRDYFGATDKQSIVAALNEKPIKAWYQSADGTGSLYIPIIGTGGEYSAKCVKIKDKLCEGDKFISRTLSGCDKVVVLDGSQLPTSVATLNTVYRIAFTLATPAVSGPQYSESFFAKTDFSLNAEHFYASTKLYVFVDKAKLAGDTKENAQQYFAAHPLTVWYRSTNYTESADIPVSLETHVKWVQILSGAEGFARTGTGVSGKARFAKEFTPKPLGAANDVAADIVCSHYKSVPSSSANGGTYSATGYGISAITAGTIYIYDSDHNTTAEDFNACLATQYAAGTPVTIVYQLATPVVYAHEPVDFEFVEGEDGVFTITGEADGTLDVYYKALQDGGDADKLGGKLPEYYAAAANALGQYTHAKSGTVHELTGSGDNIRFVATADFAAGDTVKVNGTTCTASTMSGDALWAGFFKSGAVVVCYRTGNALNFSGGGLAAAEAAKITPENLKTGVSVTVNGKTVAGTFTADGTAAAGDMLLGKTGYVKGQKVTGTIPSKAAASYKPGTSAQTIKAAQYLSGEQTIEGDAALIAANIKYGASIFDVDGSFTSDANAVAAEILTGKIGYVKGQKVTGSMPNQGAMWEKLSINGTVTIPAGYHNGQGKVTQSIPTKGAASYKPGTSAQTILSGQYLTGNQTIQGDGNLVAGNIRSGVSIFGVAGSLKYQVSYPEVLAFNLDAPSPHPTPVRTTVSAPASGNYRIQVRYSGHDSDRAGKFNVKIGKNGSWTINEYDDYDLSGTWTQDYYCNAGDQLMIEIGGYSPKASAYVIMYLNGQNAV